MKIKGRSNDKSSRKAGGMRVDVPSRSGSDPSVKTARNPLGVTARERLRTDVVELERLGPGTAPAGEQGTDPTVGSRWILIDGFEQGGRRYIVAMERPGAERLSATEWAVLHLAIAEATNKEIAYELGLAHATVRVLLHRAAAKFGVRTRAELIREFRNQLDSAHKPAESLESIHPGQRFQKHVRSGHRV